MKKIADFSIKHSVHIILITLFLTVIFGYFAAGVKMRTNIREFFPDSDPRVIEYNQVEETFGAAEYIMVAIEADDIFTKDTLHKIAHISSQLNKVEGVSDIRSLTTIDQIKGSEWGIELAPLIGQIPVGESELEQLQKKVLADDMYAGTIVSRDSSAALIIVEVSPGINSVLVAKRVQAEITEIGGPEKVYITGTPVLNDVLASSMKGDLKKLVPLVLAVIALILFLYFKNVQGVLLPFATVLISVIWTLGLMGILGKPLSPLNAVMPIILISLGNAYGIYLLNRYREAFRDSRGQREAVKGAVISVGLAILLAGGTTIAGFSSNLLSGITLMRDFGLFTSFGVAVALLVTLTFIPAVLVQKGGNFAGKKEQKDGIMEKAVSRLADTALRRSKIVLVVSLIIILLSSIGLTKLQVDSNFFNFFADDSRPRFAYNLVRDKFNGSESIEIVLKGDILQPDVLQAMKDFQRELAATGLVGNPTSLANIIERTNQAMHENKREYRKIPESSELISQYLLLLEMNDTSYLQKFVTLDYRKARIQALVRDSSSEGITELLSTITDLKQKYFQPLELETSETGIVVLLDALADLIINGQIKGIIFALVTVFLIVLLLLRSWQGSILSVILISLVILVNFGVMGWAGVPLDIVTVLISSIGIGVGIDYSIHIFSRYLEEKNRGLGVQAAMDRAINTTGLSILSNAGAVIGGFALLMLSSFPPFRYFGILVSLIMFAATAGSLLFLPALVKSFSELQARGLCSPVFTKSIQKKKGE